MMYLSDSLSMSVSCDTVNTRSKSGTKSGPRNGLETEAAWGVCVQTKKVVHWAKLYTYVLSYTSVRMYLECLIHFILNAVCQETQDPSVMH